MIGSSLVKVTNTTALIVTGWMGYHLLYSRLQVLAAPSCLEGRGGMWCLLQFIIHTLAAQFLD